MVVTDSWIICGTYEKGIQMHSLHNTRDSHVLTGHSGTVYCLGFYTSAGHTRLFSGSDFFFQNFNFFSKIFEP